MKIFLKIVVYSLLLSIHGQQILWASSSSSSSRDCRTNFNRKYATISNNQTLFITDLPRCLQLLIGEFAGVNEYDDIEQTELYIAAWLNKPAQIHILMLFGAQLHKKNKQTGYTPLHIAAELCQYQSVNYLRHLGASCYVKNRWGHTPLDLVKKKAMDHGQGPSNRIKYYTYAQELQAAGWPSMVTLEPMPSWPEMKRQWEIEHAKQTSSLQSRYEAMNMNLLFHRPWF